MCLKDGTLESLVENHGSISEDLAATAFHHMLKAIDYLAANDLIHRDLKPANILYKSHQGQYLFQLGDLGFCNHASLSKTLAGTPFYTAPEIYQGVSKHTRLMFGRFMSRCCGYLMPGGIV